SVILSLHVPALQAGQPPVEPVLARPPFVSVSPLLRVDPFPPSSSVLLGRYTGCTARMRHLRRTFHALAAVAAISLLLGMRPDAAQTPALERLKGIEELKSWFNSGGGHPRLIFLLSPT